MKTMKNESAFPFIERNENKKPLYKYHIGMTLRDYFAAKVIIIAPFNLHQIEQRAEWAYEQADAMLKERDK